MAGERGKNSSELKRYRDKRDPARTTEPFEPERPVRAEQETKAGRFVVHQHAATRMHWDVRLQIGGSLLSFAVPKGPSLDPADKRLAVHTENHPLAYLDFEDVIPEGNYGAGAMIAWDTGGLRYLETSAEEGLRVGKLDFWLSGFKLNGRFALILTQKGKKSGGLTSPHAQPQNQEWLLVKKPDVHARVGHDLPSREPRSVFSGLTVEELARRDEVRARLLARAVELGAPAVSLDEPRLMGAPPMVCALEGAPERSPDWLYELKLDGVRVVAHKQGETVRLRYRSGLACTSNYPEIVRALRSLPIEELVLDGEIVTFDERGRPNFGLLAPRFAARRAADVARARAEVPVAYLCFDLLALGSRDLRELPLLSRKDLLRELLPGNGYVRALDHIEERGDALAALCETEQLEGIVAKRKGSRYRHGPELSGHWVKLKRAREEEFVVVGKSEGKGARKELGALLLATYVGDRLVYRGKVGSGLNAAWIGTLLEQLAELPEFSGDEAFVPAAERKGARLVAPQLVVRVRFSGFTADGHLRAPVFVGVAGDKSPRDCTAAPSEERLERETERGMAERGMAERGMAERGMTEGEAELAMTERGSMLEGAEEESPATAAPAPGTRLRPGLSISNRGKVFWPNEGYTKGDLLEYYERAAPAMLPFLSGRPVVLVRYPDGIEGKSFYQWRAPEGTPSWIRTSELYDEEKQEERGTGKATFLIDDLSSLLYVVNLGCIPLHVLASREGSPTACDFLTIDFDIGSRPFREAIQLALALRQLLDDLGLSGFPKTSGQRGLHVLVPLGPGQSFETAKLLCELLGRLLVAQHGAIATMERRKDKRGDRVYVDTGQTGRSRTIVAPYSARAFAGATVSTPLGWDEVHLALDPGAFTIESVPQRLEEHGDPWEGWLDTRPDLGEALTRLARFTARLTGGAG